MNEATVQGTRCARCGLSIASWRTERSGLAFCPAFCANAAMPDYLEACRRQREQLAELVAAIKETPHANEAVRDVAEAAVTRIDTMFAEIDGSTATPDPVLAREFFEKNVE